MKVLILVVFLLCLCVFVSSVSSMTISNVYPVNNSVIFKPQPTLCFNLSSSNGSVMNYSIYVGNSNTTCTSLITSYGNVGNGSHVNASHRYVTAVNFTSYFWRVHVDNGFDTTNFTFSFNVSSEGGGYRPTRFVLGLAVLSFLLGCVVFAFIVLKKKRG